jgi:hypothetical protein
MIISTLLRYRYDIIAIFLKSERYRCAISLRFVVSTSFRCYCDIVMISLRYSLQKLKKSERYRYDNYGLRAAAIIFFFYACYHLNIANLYRHASARIIGLWNYYIEYLAQYFDLCLFRLLPVI